jgi:hypothetical protein
VYSVSHGTTSGRPQCLALRLMIDPRQRAAGVAEAVMPVAAAEGDRATA